MGSGRHIVGVMIVGMLLSAVVGAQVTTADLVGRITDASGGVLPGVTVTATHVGTGAVRSQVTSDTGDYAFTLLPIGTYEVRMELQGFRGQTARIVLASTDRGRVDGRLEVGQVTESVEVTAEAPLLQTDTSSVGVLLPSQVVENVPILDRNITRLIQMVPGAHEGGLSSAANGTRPDERRRTVAISVNGASDIENNHMIDGADNNERLMGTSGVRVSLDAIAEVRVQTNLYAAETGRTPGAVINIITKAGSNAFHGSAFEHFRDGRFNSRAFFEKQDPELRENTFGGSLGGPIRRNQTFFFADYEGYRLNQGQPNLLTLPTARMRAGDFSELLPGTVIYDPTTTPRTPFPGNVIPPDRISPIARNLLNLYPPPSGSGLANNFSGVTTRTQDSDTADLRIDHQFNQDNSLFARYSYNGVSTFTPGLCPIVDGVDPGCVLANVGGGGAFPGPNETDVHGLQANYLRVLSPTLVAEVRGGYLKLDIASFPPNEGTNAARKLGIPGANIPNATGLSAIEVIGYAYLGDQGFLPIEYHDTTRQVSGVVTKTWRAHTFKGGGGFINRWASKRGIAGSPSGNYTFNSLLTNNGAGVGGNAVASLLLGYPSAATRNFELVIPNYHSIEPSAFVQDDWRANSWLTLNLGVRYDVYSPLTEENDAISNFDLATARLLVANVDGVNRAVGVKTDYSNIAPRFGASATLPWRMVLRGGWGLSYFPTNMHSPALFRNPPFTSNWPGPTINLGPSGGVPTLFLSGGFPEPEPANAVTPRGAIAAVDSDFKSTRIQQFNVVLEKEFAGNVASVGYVGSRSDRWIGGGSGAPGRNYNLPPIGPGNIDTRRPFFSVLPGVTNITVRESDYGAWFDSLQLVFERRFRAGWSFTTHYTYAVGEWESWVPWDTARTERFRSDNEIRHKYVLTATYELPGRDLGGVAGSVLGGWQVNASAFWQSGLPFNVTNGAARTNTGAADRPNLICDPVLPGGERTLDRWFNTSCFEPQPFFTEGNAPRNLLVGPSQRQLNLSIFKTIALRGGTQLQLRAEGYNVTNTANFAPPGNALGTPTFGRISSTGNSIARQMQFAVRLMF